MASDVLADLVSRWLQVTGAALFGARGTGAFVSRKARLTYGVRGSRRFDHNDPEHMCREEVRLRRLTRCVTLHPPWCCMHVLISVHSLGVTLASSSNRLRADGWNARRLRHSSRSIFYDVTKLTQRRDSKRATGRCSTSWMPSTLPRTICNVPCARCSKRSCWETGAACCTTSGLWWKREVMCRWGTWWRSP